MRRMTGAIFRQTVPATIMRSDCRGEARNTPAPKRSMSYREETVAIISIAQHARPKVIGQMEPLRHQLMKASRLVVRTLASSCRSSRPILIPFESALFPRVEVSDKEKGDEQQDFDQPE